tara:strand:+ start:88 stop:1140 length:1053 start_codon:yes stop_codon:yes gene_type:complete
MQLMKKRTAPGILLVTAIYFIVVLIHEYLFMLAKIPAIPLSLLCLISGTILGNIISLSPSINSGRDWVKKNILQLAIIFLGFKISIAQVLELSMSSLILILMIFLLVAVLFYFLKNIFNKDQELVRLIGIGTAVCGVTAIMASSSILKSKERDVTIAILIVVLWGSIAVFAYPFLVEQMFSTPEAKGLFLGVGIHDTSQVIASALVHFDLYQQEAVLETATLTKLIRNLFLAILIPYLAISLHRDNKKASSLSLAASSLKSIPLFVYGFVAMIILRSILDNSNNFSLELERVLELNSQLVKILLSLALISLGLSINIKKLRGLMLQPTIVGFVYSGSIFIVGYVLITHII